MKIQIKTFHGRPTTTGFYPKNGIRLRPGQTFEFEDGEEDLFNACLDTGYVEPVIERPKRGRPKNEETSRVEQ